MEMVEDMTRHDHWRDHWRVACVCCCCWACLAGASHAKSFTFHSEWRSRMGTYFLNSVHGGLPLSVRI